MKVAGSADHRLHPRAAHADAGTDRIDAGIVRQHCDLGARAGIARDRLDLDDAVVDFRHFLREQLGHELRMGAGEEDLRAARFLAHVHDVGANAVAGVEVLARDGLVALEQGLGPAQIHDHVAVFDALDEAVDDFADAVLVFFVLALAFGLAHFLHDHLLGGLGGDAAEFDGRQRIDQKFADRGVGLLLLRLRERYLGEFVLDGLDHFGVAGERDRAVGAVDRGANVVFVPVFGASGFLDRLFHRHEHFLAFDALVAGDRVGHLQKLGPRVHRPFLGLFLLSRSHRPILVSCCGPRGSLRAGESSCECTPTGVTRALNVAPLPGRGEATPSAPRRR